MKEIEYENLGKLNAPFFTDFKVAFSNTLQGGWYILGTEVVNFEKEFAFFCNTPFCAGLASGLDALIIALRALNLKEKSEVIVPSNTYIATILSIIQAGLKPVLVEPDVETYNICPKKIEESITSRTSAIMIVHLYGKCCDMDSIQSICERKGIKLIEDTAQAHGATFKGKMAGTFGDFGAFSFYPTKNLGAIGDAGALTTNQESLLTKVKSLRNYGSKVKYVNEIVGYNSRLDEVQAAFLRIKLKQLPAINNHKRRLASLYLKHLSDAFIKPVVHQDYHDVYHIFNIRHPQRDKIREYLASNGIKTEIHYPIPPHRQEAMKGILDSRNFPISEEIHATTLSLPISYFHSDDDIFYVIETLNKFQ
jgi:dTDP-4-amino-4,6-dideoxygalactose transaminase